MRRHTNSISDPKNTNLPVLVHCSAGVGRTGVVLLSEILIACLEYNEVCPAQTYQTCTASKYCIRPSVRPAAHLKVLFLSLSDAGHPQRPVPTACAEDDDGPDVCAVQFHLQGSHPVLAQLQVDMSRREIPGRRVMEHEETRNLPLISIIYRYLFYFFTLFLLREALHFESYSKVHRETTNAAFKKENLYFLTFGFFSVDEAHFENIALNVAVSVLLSAYMKDLDTIAFVTQESRCVFFFFSRLDHVASSGED